MKVVLLFLMILLPFSVSAQNFGELEKISSEKLLRDFDLLQQAIEQYHSGAYWYTPKDSFDRAFQQTRASLQKPMNELEFHKTIAPLVCLTREDHCNIFLSSETQEHLRKNGRFFPFVVKFLDQKLYIVQNASAREADFIGKEILQINGENVASIVKNLGGQFASDGYIQAVKYSDLDGLAFARQYFLYYGLVDQFNILLQGENGNKEYNIPALSLEEARINLATNTPNPSKSSDEEPDNLEYRILTKEIAYLGVHTFASSAYKKNKVHRNYKKFLREAFLDIQEKQIRHLIIDMRQNGGGSEGNENLLYSYLDDNYQKYKSVTAKAQKLSLDNGKDKPLKIKTFGFFERVFGNRKRADGSYERKENIGFGLRAYKKEPVFKYRDSLYVLIHPVTYSGGSEFANMLYTRQRATFIGEETGGGFYGNTSGYSYELELPHSGIIIDIPALKFEMNVEGLPFGRGVIPHHRVIPSIEEYLAGQDVVLAYTLDLIKKQAE